MTAAMARATASPRKLGWKLLLRDARSGELNLLVASLVLAVAAVSCINLFTDRIQRSIAAQASTLLAADVQVRGNEPAPDDWRRRAAQVGLTTADIVTFRGMAIADSGMELARVKAVDSAYPLKGELLVADQPYGEPVVVKQGPPPGEIWLTSRLFAALGVSMGDSIAIGNANFTITAALLREPDNSGSFFGGGARVMINAEEVPRTGAVQPGSRVNYRWLLAGAPGAIDALGDWLKPKLSEHYEWVTPGGNNSGVGEAMVRSQRFLLLAGSLAVVLAGAALALASRRYAARQRGTVALLKTLGLGPAAILRLYLSNVILLGLASTFVGLILGWLLHRVILLLMGELLPPDLAPAGIAAYLAGAGVGLLVLLGFAVPPLAALRKVAPVSVLRSTPSEISALWQGIPGAVAVVLLVLGYSRSPSLTAYLTIGGLLAICGVSLMASGLVRLCAHLARRLRKGSRLGLANLYRHRRHNSVQIMLFSILLLLLFVIYTLRTSMLEDWRQQLPDDTPNHFAFNIFTNEKDEIQTLFDQEQVDTSPFYPMVRGRLIAVNGEEARQRARELGGEPDDDRELNLTWSDALGIDNKVVAGEWWDPDGPAYGEEAPLMVSFEQSYAEDYKVDVGDRVTLSLSGLERKAQVASIRTVQWDSMQPNFYLIFNQPLMDGAAVNWLTSFYLPPEQKEFVNQLGTQFPTVSLVELDQMIDQIQTMMEQVSGAVEFILILIVSAGVLVLIASIQATLDIRLQESALLRTLGAGRRLVFTSLLIEFSAMGLLAGVMGVAGAELSLYFLQTSAFEMVYSPHWSLWWAGPLLGVLLVGGIGLLSTASVVRVPPMAVLRRG